MSRLVAFFLSVLVLSGSVTLDVHAVEFPEGNVAAWSAFASDKCSGERH